MSKRAKRNKLKQHLVFAAVLPLNENSLSPKIWILRISESGFLDDRPGLCHVLVLQLEIRGHEPESDNI